MEFDEDIRLFEEPMPRIVVASHERSGTHFLMNSMASCFGYVSAPWLDYDYSYINLNYYQSGMFSRFLAAFDGVHLANTIKTHHSMDFLRDDLPDLGDRTVILYIVRNVVDVMRSFRRFLMACPWNEGPKVDTLDAFLGTPPSGYLMRYQVYQEDSMASRWAHHVEGWLAAAADFPNIVVVRYEDLHDRFDDTIDRIGKAIGHTPDAIVRPEKGVNVIGFGADRDDGGDGGDLSAAALSKVRDVAGDVLVRLGYTL